MNECLLNRTEKEQSLRLKVRQHVNPLSSKYQIPVNLPGNWMCEAFEDAQRPLIIDVGCAKGILGTSICLAYMHPSIRLLLYHCPHVVSSPASSAGSWLLKMAGGNSSCNFLGLEIRRPVVRHDMT